jgi:hypothetical protein
MKLTTMATVASSTEPLANTTKMPMPSAITKASSISPQPISSNFSLSRHIVETMAGLYGDLQGIAGRSLQEIDGLEMPLLDRPAASEAAE